MERFKEKQMGLCGVFARRGIIVRLGGLICSPPEAGYRGAPIPDHVSTGAVESFRSGRPSVKWRERLFESDK
jgi:hypothetical protein